MKTIVYTGAFRFPTGDAGASRVLNNAKILRQLGYKVIFVGFGGVADAGDKREDGNYYYQGFRYIISSDIDISRRNSVMRLYNFFFSGHKALKIIQKLVNKEKIDIVIGYSISMFFSNKISSFCKINNFFFIADITEWSDSREFPGGKFAPPAWINSWNMNFTQKKVKNKILISSFLDKFYKTSNNIILPPLVDPNDTKWINSTPVLPFYEGIRIIYVGTPTNKDLLETMLVAVISCLKEGLELQFVVVGVTLLDISCYESYKNVLKFPLNIIFCGRVLQTEVPFFYKESDFSIIVREPTRKSMAGFPTKLAETMMAGCPVILNYTSDINKYVEDDYNGFVMSDWSSIGLKNVLYKIIKLSEHDLERLKINSLQTALDKFSYLMYSDITENFMHNLKK